MIEANFQPHDESVRALRRAEQAERDLARFIAHYGQLKVYSAELESLVIDLQDKCNTLETEITSLRSSFSGQTFDQLIINFAKQQDEINRLELILARQRQQAIAAVCILQGECDADSLDDAIHPEMESTHDLESRSSGSCDV